MMFTRTQYLVAMQSLADGLTQLEPDGLCCSICGDSGHQAFECGHNPLFAMKMCELISTQSGKLHDILHYLAGYETSFGVQVGPSRVVMPE